MTRLKIGLKFGLLGAIVDYGCETRLSQYSTIGAAMTVGTIAGVNLRIKYVSQSIFYSFSLLVCYTFS